MVIDGAKALAKAVAEVFDAPVIQRCQLHKIRNVRDHLPERLRGPVESRMRQAYHAESTLDAQAQLEALAKELERTHPGAAASLREGLAETLTILRLAVPPTLARTLRSTNAIESMISICREHAKNVKHWQDGTMALRWCAAGMLEAGKQFRRVNGHLHLPALRAALARPVDQLETVSASSQNETVNAGLETIGPPPKFHGTRDNLRDRPGSAGRSARRHEGTGPHSRRRFGKVPRENRLELPRSQVCLTVRLSDVLRLPAVGDLPVSSVEVQQAPLRLDLHNRQEAVPEHAAASLAARPGQPVPRSS